MSGIAFGIDLGTSTSEIAYFENGQPYIVPDPNERNPIVPSCVAIDSNDEILVGEAARAYDNSQENRRVIEVKRKMGTGEYVRLLSDDYRPEEISALILMHLKGMAERLVGQDVRDVVISVPANFSDPAKAATRDAGDLAGLRVLRLINEPTAAALAFGVRNIDVEEQIVVFDFGGGTLDITVLEMIEGILDVHSSVGDTTLGGRDIDEKLMALILKKFEQSYRPVDLSWQARVELKRQAEAAKCVLSEQTSAQVFVRDIVADVNLDVEITRDEFNKTISPILDRTRDCIKRALNEKKIRPSAIDRVLLVGGTTFVPAVRELVAEIFGREPASDVDPQLAVAQGACIQAAIIEGIIPPEDGIILTDVAPIGLGVEILSIIGRQPQLVYDSLIERQTKIPYSVKKEYSLIHEEQTSVEVKVYQDPKGGARRLVDVEDIGLTGNITNIPISVTGAPHPVEIEFSYDLNGIIELSARIPTTGQQIDLRYEASHLRLDDIGKQEAKERLEELWSKNEKAVRYRALIDKATRLRDEVDADIRQNIDIAIDTLKTALVENNDGAIETAGDNLTDLLWDIENS
jgi:molecular chaperone DnaK